MTVPHWPLDGIIGSFAAHGKGSFGEIGKEEGQQNLGQDATIT
jgi:hypothetical protein